MSDRDITELLSRVGRGETGSMERLFEVVYDDLKRRAHFQLAGGGRTLNTTALVHETYLKLARSGGADWSDRLHFFRVAARAMRQIVIDRARTHLAQKRGGDAVIVSLEDFDGASGPAAGAAPDAALTLLALDRGLSRLAEQSPRLAEVVELRFFGGLSVEEAAHALDVSERTVKRDWRLARAFLQEAIQGASSVRDGGAPDD